MIADGYKYYQFRNLAEQSAALANCHLLLPEDISEDTADFLYNAFALFALYEASHPVPCPEQAFIFIGFKGGHIDLHPDPGTLGNQANCMFVDLDRTMRKQKKLTRVQIPLEEMVHAFYQIKNETLAKVVVKQILSQQYSQITLHSLYPGVFDAEDTPLSKY